MTEAQYGERIRALEVRVETLTEVIEKQDQKLSDLVAIFQQAKGARWAILASAGVAGFLASYLPTVGKLLGVVR